MQAHTLANLRNQLNFSAGPGALPESVLLQLQQAIIEVPDVGLSILGISHRSDWFAAVISELENNIRSLLGLSKNYHVLFLQGGATQQFFMVPLTLLHGTRHQPDYLHTGYWSGKAIAQARHAGSINVIWSGAGSNFTHLPDEQALHFSAAAPYLHYVSNETVEGLQFHRVLGRDDVPRVCDMSSDFLSQPCEAGKFSLIYAHAQKNIGPAGVTVVLLDDKILANYPEEIPGFLDYRKQIEAHSIYNTPPVFAIYAVLLVSRWLLHDIGGVARMAEINRGKAQLLYHLLDENKEFYIGRATPNDRSMMNVNFNLTSLRLEEEFIAAAHLADMSGLAGHRSIGGIRVSLYNAVTPAAVERLANFMEDFQREHTNTRRPVS